MIVKIGTKTKFGKVSAVMFQGEEHAERFYMCIDDNGCVSLIPADIIEQ